MIIVLDSKHVLQSKFVKKVSKQSENGSYTSPLITSEKSLQKYFRNVKC